MIISKPIHKFDDSKIIYSANITFLDEINELYFSVDRQFANMISSSSDPLLISMLVPCMQNREDLIIEGKVSKQLYDNLNHIQDILCIVIPHLHKINVYVDEVFLKPYSNESPNIFTGFSAGVDSFITFEDYFLNPKYDLKITHFLFNNINHKEQKLNLKMDNISKFVKKYNFPLIQTTTNLHSFYRKHRKIGFEQTHTIRNAAIPHFLSGIDNIFLYSSTFHKSMIQVKESNDLAIVDDLLLPSLSTSSSECKAVGSEYTRLDKTIKVSMMEDAYEHLDTCIGVQTKEYINCGICRKCTRALLTFEIINKKDSFSKVFNLKEWDKIKNTYISELPSRTQLNDNELYNYVRKNFTDILN